MSIQIAAPARVLRNAGITCAMLVALVSFPAKSIAYEQTVPLSEDQVKIVKRVTPTYPVIARQMKLSGKVVVDLTLNDDGTVENASTISGSPVLATAAVQAGKSFKFEPVKNTAGGKPVVRVVFSFEKP